MACHSFHRSDDRQVKHHLQCRPHLGKLKAGRPQLRRVTICENGWKQRAEGRAKWRAIEKAYIQQWISIGLMMVKVHK